MRNGLRKLAAASLFPIPPTESQPESSVIVVWPRNRACLSGEPDNRPDCHQNKHPQTVLGLHADIATAQGSLFTRLSTDFV